MHRVRREVVVRRRVRRELAMMRRVRRELAMMRRVRREVVVRRHVRRELAMMRRVRREVVVGRRFCATTAADHASAPARCVCDRRLLLSRRQARRRWNHGGPKGLGGLC